MGSIKKILFLICILTLSVPGSSYTDSVGVEEGDKVNLNYTLTVDGNFEDSGTLTNAEISPNGGYIEGFWKGVIGMNVGQNKTITVDPSEGYTNSGHPLYGKTLVFEVHLLEVVDSVSPTDGNGGEGDNNSSNPDPASFNFYFMLFGLLSIGILVRKSLH